MYDSLSALPKTFKIIDENIKKASFGRDVVEQVTESIISSVLLGFKACDQS